MIPAKPFAAALFFALPALAAAQTTAPVATAPVAGANAAVDADVAARDAATATSNADASAQYAADVAAYRRALRQHHRALVRNDRREIAYAEAMRDWRQQVYDCKHGHSAACNAPTPDPADYY